MCVVVFCYIEEYIPDEDEDVVLADPEPKPMRRAGESQI